MLPFKAGRRRKGERGQPEPRRWRTVDGLQEPSSCSVTILLVTEDRQDKNKSMHNCHLFSLCFSGFVLRASRSRLRRCRIYCDPHVSCFRLDCLSGSPSNGYMHVAPNHGKILSFEPYDALNPLQDPLSWGNVPSYVSEVWGTTTHVRRHKADGLEN